MIWKHVPSFPVYEVSEYGLVRSNRGILKMSYSAEGYPKVSLRYNGKYYSRTVHVLVCEAFHGPKPTDKHEVCHSDGSKDNNNYKNLRWDTRKNNIADARKHGTFQRGERQGSAKLTDKKVLEIRRRHKKGERAIDLAKEFKMSKSMIHYVVNRHNWKHI